MSNKNLKLSLKLLIPVTLLLLLVAFIGYYKINNKEEVNTNFDAMQIENKITNEDIEAGKEIIKKYFRALNDSNLEEMEKTLGKYKSGLYHKDNIGNFEAELINIEYPGKYTNDNIPPSSYKSNYGVDPYKTINFYVEFKDKNIGRIKGWDYILVKDNKNDPWTIHDWGY